MSCRLATFNIESLDWSQDQSAWFETRAKALRPILDDLRPDILCLQEVHGQHLTPDQPRSLVALSKLIDGTALAGFHIAHSQHPDRAEPVDKHNLAILSRWPIETQRQILHDYVQPRRWRSPEGEDLTIAFDRPALHVQIAQPGAAPLHVFNLHLRAPRAAPVPGGRIQGQWTSTKLWAQGYFIATLKRQAQALEVRLAVEELLARQPQAHVVVCGDLNAESFEAPTRLLQALPEDVETNAFEARALLPLEARLPPDQRFSVVHNGRKVLLDHILASAPLAERCSSVTALNDGLADEALATEPVAGSLHGPLLAIFD